MHIASANPSIVLLKDLQSSSTQHPVGPDSFPQLCYLPVEAGCTRAIARKLFTPLCEVLGGPVAQPGRASASQAPAEAAESAGGPGFKSRPVHNHQNAAFALSNSFYRLSIPHSCGRKKP